MWYKVDEHQILLKNQPNLYTEFQLYIWNLKLNEAPAPILMHWVESWYL